MRDQRRIPSPLGLCVLTRVTPVAREHAKSAPFASRCVARDSGLLSRNGSISKRGGLAPQEGRRTEGCVNGQERLLIGCNSHSCNPLLSSSLRAVPGTEHPV